MKRQEEKNIEKIVSELKEALIIHNSFDKAEIKNAISELEEKVNKTKEIYRKIRDLFFLMFIGLSVSIAFIFSMQDRSDALRTKIENLEYRDSLFKKFMEPDSVTHTFIYRVREGEPVTYKKLLSENDSINKMYYDAKNKERETKVKLELIQKNYPISFSEKNNYIRVQSPKIDSALLLLDYYRHKLSYDNEKQVWTIQVETNKEYD